MPTPPCLGLIIRLSQDAPKEDRSSWRPASQNPEMTSQGSGHNHLQQAILGSQKPVLTSMTVPSDPHGEPSSSTVTRLLPTKTQRIPLDARKQHRLSLRSVLPSPVVGRKEVLERQASSVQHRSSSNQAFNSFLPACLNSFLCVSVKLGSSDTKHPAILSQDRTGEAYSVAYS